MLKWLRRQHLQKKLRKAEHLLSLFLSLDLGTQGNSVRLLAHHETTEQILRCPHRQEIEPLLKSFGKVTKQIYNCIPQEETTIIPGEEKESDFRVTKIPYSKCLVLNKKLQSARARVHTRTHTHTHTEVWPNLRKKTSSIQDGQACNLLNKDLK